MPSATTLPADNNRRHQPSNINADKRLVIMGTARIPQAHACPRLTCSACEVARFQLQMTTAGSTRCAHSQCSPWRVCTLTKPVCATRRTSITGVAASAIAPDSKLHTMSPTCRSRAVLCCRAAETPQHRVS